jgi:CrcB protein
MTPAHHLNPRLVALVALGGMIGTSGRYLISQAMPSHGGWPVATFVANVLGSFLLGALLEALLRHGPESPRGRAVRLGVGAGVLGGFTTFSSLALELERFLAHDALLTAATYAVASLTGGLLACLLGVVLAARHHVWRRARDPRRTDPPSSGESGR